MTDDPFQKAKDIRSGKLDSELPPYEELTGWLQRAPMTWLPGLLMRIVALCVVKKVFVSNDGLVRAVRNTADNAEKGTEALR